MGTVSWPRGKGSCRIRREVRSGHARHVVFVPNSSEGMTDGSRLSAAKEGGGTASGARRDGPRVGLVPRLKHCPGPFKLFPIFIFFSFLFSFDFCLKTCK
jgi:hypothetical protein